MRVEPVLGKHGWNEPDTLNFPGYETFSVGIYEWVQGKDGLKKSKAKVRVWGKVSDQVQVFRKVNLIVRRLNNDNYSGPKNVRIK